MFQGSQLETGNCRRYLASEDLVLHFTLTPWLYLLKHGTLIRYKADHCVSLDQVRGGTKLPFVRLASVDSGGSKGEVTAIDPL